MNRSEYIAQLSFQLRDISPSDRADAITYYNGYFDEAGPENEERVIKELGNPTDVAKGIKAGLQGDEEDGKQYTETGYQDKRFEQKEMPGVVSSEKKKKDSTTIILIVIIAILSAPIWGSIVASIGGILIGLACALFGLLLGLFFGGIGLVIAGVYATISGFMCATLGSGLLSIGGGLLCICFGLVCILLFALIAGKAMPLFIHWFANLCRKLTAKLKRKGDVTA